MATIVYAALLAADVLLFLLLPQPWPQKVAAASGIITVYGLVVGMVASTNIGKFGDVGRAMTSPVLADFLWANFFLFSIGLVAVRNAAAAVRGDGSRADVRYTLSPDSKEQIPKFDLSRAPVEMELPDNLLFLAVVAAVISSLLLVVMSVIQTVVIVPIAYLAYRLASVPLWLLMLGEGRLITEKGDETSELSVRDALASSAPALRSGLVSLLGVIAASVVGLLFTS